MAEYVKSRMTAAKVGVGLALFGLFAGVMEKVRSQDSNHATLGRFGLTRPFPGAAEADHIQLA